MAAPRARGGQNYAYAGNAANNKQAQLANAYQELAKELSSEKLKVVGAYTLGRVIGEGAYGSVHIATHRLTGIRCAIKKIPKSFTPQLTREIHHHRRLQHPHIVHLHEIVATESHVWLVSELCSGGELFDYLVERGRILEGEARRLFGELTVAVGFMHRHGVVHRDLKLENVLLDGELRVKLGDLGFVREWQKGRLMDTFCGTTGYASPEMLTGRKYLGVETDIWSLGVILYTLLCGGLPFDHDDENAMKDLILKGEYEEPEWLSDDAKSLIGGMLQQDPNKRLSIEAILSHPWFKKTLVDTLPDHDQTHSNQHSPNLSSPLAQSNPFFADAFSKDNDNHANKDNNLLGPPSSGISPGQSPLSNGPVNFFPPQSGSETSETSLDHTESDHTKADTGITTPTTGENEDLADIKRVHSGEFSQTERELEMLHSNVSQSTIRKGGGESPHLGSGVKSRVAVKSVLEGQQEVDEEAVSDAEMSTGVDSGRASAMDDHSLALPVVSQHNRTPSRTKRRSVSSTLTLERRHSHHSTSGQWTAYHPEDYLGQLSHPDPEPFSTPSEKHLLQTLSDIGFNTGQLVHSVTNYACDTAAATWWMLRNKQAERGETDEVVMARDAALARRKERAALLEREDKERRDRKRHENGKREVPEPKHTGVTFKEETTAIPFTSLYSHLDLGPPVVTPSRGVVASPDPIADSATRAKQAEMISSPQIRLSEPPRGRNEAVANTPQTPPQGQREADLPKTDTAIPLDSPSIERPPTKTRSPSLSMLQRATSVLVGGSWKGEERVVVDDADGKEGDGKPEKRSGSPTKLTKSPSRPKMGIPKSESDPTLLAVPMSASSSFSRSPERSPVTSPGAEAGPSHLKETGSTQFAQAMLSSDNILPRSSPPGKVRQGKRDSLWSTFRYLFNEDKRRRKRAEPGSPLLTEVKVAPTVVLSRGIAARGPHVGRTAQPVILRHTSTDGRPGFSRRTSSANSRRSSISGPDAHSSQDALPPLGRRTSARSHGSQTPTSEPRDPSSRPSSVHEVHIHAPSSRRSSYSVRSPSLASDASGRFKHITPASPLHNYHRRAPAGSASTRVRHIRVIPEAQIIRSSSVASSIRSNTSSRASSRDRAGGREGDSDYDTGREDNANSIHSHTRRSRGSDDRLSSLAQQIHRKSSPLTLPAYYSYHGHGHHGHRKTSLVPKAPLRDVFQQKDDEWISDDDEPTYSGGLGQAGGGGSNKEGKNKWDTKATTFPSYSSVRNPRGMGLAIGMLGGHRAVLGGNGGNGSSSSNSRPRRGSGSDEETRGRTGKDERGGGGGGQAAGRDSAGAGEAASAGGGGGSARRRGIPSGRGQPGVIEEEEEGEE